MPNTLIGSLYYGEGLDNIQFKPLNNTSTLQSIPLLASNIFRNWVELNYKLNFIYHVPILTTPGVDSKRFNFGFSKVTKSKIIGINIYPFKKSIIIITILESLLDTLLIMH